MAFFNLLSQSPELNPDERFNAEMKREIRAAAATRTKAKRHDASAAHTETVQSDPKHVMRYFNDAYAKDATA